MASSSDDARRLQNIDLAFVMDCTASMGSYIEHAKKVTFKKFIKTFNYYYSNKKLYFKEY